MKIISRYVVREHIGPLAFALTALTSLLMLQYVARQLANLAGKGLPARAIVEFFVLSLPFTIAMTLPMAVLIATLHAFGRMASENEITAFKANGVRVRTLMAPVLFCALLLSLAMVWFNDQVLPAANYRLRNLQQDILRTTPTLALRDQVINQLRPSFFMRVARTDAATNKMWDVDIYDLSRGTERRTIYADSGRFSLAENKQDMQLQLYDGFSQELVKGDPKRLQRSYFRTQSIWVRDVGRDFQASGSDGSKSDREMSVCEMHRRYRARAVEYARAREEYISIASKQLKPGETGVQVPRERSPQVALSAFYCNTLPSLVAMAGIKTAQAQSAVTNRTVAWTPDTRDIDPRVQPPVTGGQTSVQQPPAGQPPVGQPPAGQPPAGQPPPAVDPTQNPVVVPQPPAVPPAVPIPVPAPVQVPDPRLQLPVNAIDVPPGTMLPQPVDDGAQLAGAEEAAALQMNATRSELDSLNVEIQKKFALSFACLVFVLFGPPIALRFPRGGVGVTLGVGIVVFGLYYVCLMGGETLSDRGQLPPPVSMWIANVLFALMGIALLWNVESTTDKSRGGGIRDWWADRRARKNLIRQAA